MILKRIQEGSAADGVIEDVKEGFGAFADHSAHEAQHLNDNVQNFAKDKVSEAQETANRVSEGTKTIFIEGINYIKEVVKEHQLIPKGDL